MAIGTAAPSDFQPLTNTQVQKDAAPGNLRPARKLLIINPNTSLMMSQGITDLINASSMLLSVARHPARLADNQQAFSVGLITTYTQQAAV